MRGVDDSIVHQSGKYAESTWGVIFHFENRKDVVLTWGEVKNEGDPFFININPSDEFVKMPSLQAIEFNKYSPWSTYIDRKITSVVLCFYSTNYGGLWHGVPLGILFEFDDNKRMLIAALHHKDFMDYLLCADEVVIIFDHELIDLVIQTHLNFKSEWQDSRINNGKHET